MPTRGASGSMPAAVQAWRMLTPVGTRSTVTSGKSGRPAPSSQATCRALSASRGCPSGAGQRAWSGFVRLVKTTKPSSGFAVLGDARKRLGFKDAAMIGEGRYWIA